MPILSYLSNIGMGGGSSVTPAVVVVTPRSDGGQRHRHSFRYDRWGKKKKQALKRSPEAVQIVQEIANEYESANALASLSSALKQLESALVAEKIRAVDVYRELLTLELDRLEYEKEEDEDFLLLH